MWTVWGRGEVHAEFWWGNLRHRDRLEDLDTDETIILKEIFKKRNGSLGLD
jgi:hypothetical protein